MKDVVANAAWTATTAWAESTACMHSAPCTCVVIPFNIRVSSSLSSSSSAYYSPLLDIGLSNLSPSRSILKLKSMVKQNYFS
jgi:hypothetical protein